jgi:hypothetical protein
MIYRESGFLGFVCFVDPPPPPSPSPVRKLDQRHTGRLRKRDSLLTGEVGEGMGVEPNHTTVRKHRLL